MKDLYNEAFYKIGKYFMAVAAAAAIFIWIFNDGWMTAVPDCIFETVTGIYCPGCGGTRAFIALCRGHIIRSFIYHPFVPYFFVVYIIFMVRMFLMKHYHIGNVKGRRVLLSIYCGIGLIVMQWIIKLILLIKYGIRFI